MPDYRITDSGDIRVLENGSDFRIVRELTFSGDFTGSSVGSLSSVSTQDLAAASAMGGIGSLSSEAYRDLAAFSSMSSQGSLGGVGSLILSAYTFSGSNEFVRETDTTDIRITESGDTRITDLIGVNVIEAMAYFDDTYVPFSANLYVKNLSVWSEFIPYVKHNGSWIEPERVSVKEGGIWKRVY